MNRVVKDVLFILVGFVIFMLVLLAPFGVPATTTVGSPAGQVACDK